MKYLVVISMALLLGACTGPIKHPQVAFGKKCAVNENGQVSYSYVWIYDKKEGLAANAKECDKISD